jgi:hypothetical protein
MEDNMRDFNARFRKLLDLFDFFMSVKFGGECSITNCPFPEQRGWLVDCRELCGIFFGTGHNCPCSKLGATKAMDDLETLLKKEGLIDASV